VAARVREEAAEECSSTAVGSSGNGAVRGATAAVRDDGPERVVTFESASRGSVFQGQVLTAATGDFRHPQAIEFPAGVSFQKEPFDSLARLEEPRIRFVFIVSVI
jgi:hypothetical protein